MPAWRDAGPQVRAAVCVEIVDRINRRSFEIANAVMHTSGQPFVMSFQAGGPHAQDRAIEAVAAGLVEQERVPTSVVWEKPGKDREGKPAPLRMQKDYRIVPRGVALVIGCNTFPTWNAYPGIFASLVTGNPVVVKPHPRAVLPLAISVEIARAVLEEAGFDPALVQLAAEADGQGLAKTLAERDEVAIIDYTGGPSFGGWLEQAGAAAGKLVYTEKAGINTIVVDSTDNLRGMLGNLAFSLDPLLRPDVHRPAEHLRPRGRRRHRRGPPVLRRVRRAARRGHRPPDRRRRQGRRAARRDGQRPGAHQRRLARRRSPPTPTGGSCSTPAASPTRRGPMPSCALRASSRSTCRARTSTPRSASARWASSSAPPRRSSRSPSSPTRSASTAAMTAAVYSTSEDVLERAREAAAAGGVALSENLTGQVFVNQTAAFSDYHGTGANPAANAAYTDAAFVAGRFRVITSRRHV